MAFMNVKDVAAALSLKPENVYVMCRKKQIRHMRVGAGKCAYRFRQEWIDEYLQSCEIEVEAVDRAAARREAKAKALEKARDIRAKMNSTKPGEQYLSFAERFGGKAS